MSTATTSAAATRISPDALMAIRNLELRARAVVEGFWSGIHRSPYHGFSVEFSEYRQYTPGDDPRYLDWRVFARRDRYFIKRYEDETNVRCQLLVDQSRSMDYGSRGYTKAQYAATLAATLAYFLQLQGDAVGLLTFDEHVREYLPARHRPGHLRHLMLALDRPSGGARTDVAAAVDRVASLLRKRGLVTLISDFLAPIDTLRPKLTALAAGGHEVDVFQIFDPAELDLGDQAPSRFEDLETGRAVYVDPTRARAAYRERVEAHFASLRQMCRDLGAGYHALSTAEPLGTALFEFLQQRMRRGRRQTSHRVEHGRTGAVAADRV
jgi:uncharacterized protein (DUF58 family)